jgi:hypothetical protein
MRKTLLATAITGSLLVLGSPIKADDFSINAAPTGGDDLPKKGTATYSGTFALSGVWAGVAGPIELYVDFATGTVIADLTIPSLGQGAVASTPEHYTPEGDITLNGKKAEASYVLTEGVSFSADSPFIAVSGSFSGPHGRNTAGSFDANFCYEACSTGVYVVRSISGTFSATKTRSK